jgi:hypothetical protein
MKPFVIALSRERRRLLGVRRWWGQFNQYTM